MSQKVQEATPDLWMYHMKRGNFDEAWKKSDQDLKSRAGQPCWHWPRHFQYIWDGTPLAGKRVLVRCYHGLGDTIQFIRYMPLVKEIAKEVIVWAQAPLIPLLKTVTGIDQLLPLHDGTPEADYDVDVEIMELPHIFRTTLATIPSRIPYLHTEPLPLPSENGLPKVGLVWKAGDWDERRSLPFSFLKPLAGLKNIQFYILQADAPANGWDGTLGVYLGNFSLEDYARVIRGLDLVITVDSMPAHLAGTLGVPVWTLLHAEADWRWMENREDSPWYPTMQLFRQTQPGDCAGVIQRIKEELRKFSK
ncbi:glycosyltransferase family 9 protein [Adhaeribacter radiodurans]|uniref:ADP-heptose--LPS heptosyltransferase n=1 Tax=Adhaeribacter radiodurans TaxID=2745197 RepID=A0A7L7L902_9BACT|nr:glycosyltransferase family 9 protein [Adhaeribacter radiodurans]QMU29204.1 ADP-heptose--LPS heptosyltransferase [Adhaeribacter radiodurans]